MATTIHRESKACPRDQVAKSRNIRYYSLNVSMPACRLKRKRRGAWQKQLALKVCLTHFNPPARKRPPPQPSIWGAIMMKQSVSDTDSAPTCAKMGSQYFYLVFASHSQAFLS